VRASVATVMAVRAPPSFAARARTVLAQLGDSPRSLAEAVTAAKKLVASESLREEL